MSGNSSSQSEDYDLLPPVEAPPPPRRPAPIVSENEKKCPGCGYDLRSQTGDFCPECGRTWRQAIEAHQDRWEVLEWFFPFRYAFYMVGITMVWGLLAWPIMHTQNLLAIFLAGWVGRLLPVAGGVYAGYMASEESSAEDGLMTAVFVAAAAAGLTYLTYVVAISLIL